MITRFHIGFILVLFFVGISFDYSEDLDMTLDKDQSVIEVLSQIGFSNVNHIVDETIPNVSAAIGEDIVKYGFSERDGLNKSKRQSKHFVCISCHNTEREDPDLTKADPDARLHYVTEKGMPFLQATTLYGAVNRTSFYNGDYEKKYGELIKPARNNIREAIKLCAVECAQGRELQDWETESILAYLWTIDLKLGDLILNAEEESAIALAQKDEGDPFKAIEIIENKYAKSAPVHFLDPSPRNQAKFNISGDAQNGKLVYEKSCLHCHYRNKYSYLNLDNNGLTFDFLDRKADTYSRYSIYEVVRHGTYSMNGKASYMPRYPKEKMSDQQLEDLRAYLSVMAK